MKTLSTILMLALSILMLGSCSKQESFGSAKKVSSEEKPSLVGDWKISSVESKPEDLSSTVLSTRCEVTFRSNGTTSITLWGDGDEVTDQIEGGYSVEGDQLVISGSTIQTYRLHYEFIEEDLIIKQSEKDLSIRATFSKTKKRQNNAQQTIPDTPPAK